MTFYFVLIPVEPAGMELCPGVVTTANIVHSCCEPTLVCALHGACLIQCSSQVCWVGDTVLILQIWELRHTEVK